MLKHVMKNAKTRMITLIDDATASENDLVVVASLGGVGSAHYSQRLRPGFGLSPNLVVGVVVSWLHS